MDLADKAHLSAPLDAVTQLEAKPASDTVVDLQSASMSAADASDSPPCERPCLSELVSCLSVCPAIEPSFQGDPNALLGYQFVRPANSDLIHGEKPLIDPGPPKTVPV